MHIPVCYLQFVDSVPSTVFQRDVCNVEKMFHNNCVFIIPFPNQTLYSRLQCFSTYHQHKKAKHTPRVVAIL